MDAWGINEMHLRDMVVELIGENRADEFGRWAFGDNFETTLLVDLIEKWNVRHKDNYELKQDNPIAKDIVKMISLWRLIDDD